MASYLIILVLSFLPFCLGSGAGYSGGVGGIQIGSSEVPDDVKVIKVGKPLEFNCNNTTPDGGEYDIDWYKNEETITSDDRVHAYSTGKLLYDTATEDDVGNYTCKARNGGPEKMFTALTISYKKLPKSGIAIEEDKLTLICEAEGIPTPLITWTKDNVSITEAVEPERLQFPESEKFPPNATLQIIDVKQGDRGLYVCYISNHEGLVFNTTSFVRVKDLYAALWPFLGIVAEVVILCLVIFIYEKRRSKNDFDESDTDQGGST